MFGSKLSERLDVKAENMLFEGLQLTRVRRPRFADFSTAEELEWHGSAWFGQQQLLFDRPIFPLETLPEACLEQPLFLLTEQPQAPYAIISFVADLYTQLWFPRTRFNTDIEGSDVLRAVYETYFNNDEACWNAGLELFLNRAKRDGILPLFVFQDTLVMLAARDLLSGDYVDYTDVATKYHIPSYEILAQEASLADVAHVMDQEPSLMVLRAYVRLPELGMVPVSIPSDTYLQGQRLYRLLHPRTMAFRTLVEETLPTHLSSTVFQETWIKLRLHYLNTCELIDTRVAQAQAAGWTDFEFYQTVASHKLCAAIMKKFRNPQLSTYGLVACQIMCLTNRLVDAEEYVDQALRAEVDL